MELLLDNNISNILLHYHSMTTCHRSQASFSNQLHQLANMSTTLRVQLPTRIGPTTVVDAGLDEPSGSRVALQVDAHLILWADALRMARG